MAKYRNELPQLCNELYITDGGIETTLIFHEGLELPDFAAFHLLREPEGEATLLKYFRNYADIAKRFGTGLVLESATWRASSDWATRLGYTPHTLADANYKTISLLEKIRLEYETDQTQVVISGCIGPRGDGYVSNSDMSAHEAQSYHQVQIETLANSAADMVCALTMNYVAEAIGIVRAAQRVNMPVAISFTVETDGSLPSGQSLKSAITQVDQATAAYPCYYMINCAHPTHFNHAIVESGLWMERIHGFRANASSKSHAELNESHELDEGNPAELGAQYVDLKKQLSNLNVLGGCCGTDHRHVEQITQACLPLFALRPM